MKSEFVSTVTHELKTPLSLMRLVADTLVTGRYKGPEKVQEYGALVVDGGLTHDPPHRQPAVIRPVDARRTNFYAPAALDVAELLEEASGNVRSRLAQLDFTLDHRDRPRADRRARRPHGTAAGDRQPPRQRDQILGRRGHATIAMRARREDAVIIIEVEDRGSGIHDEDLPNVTEKFFRGRQARGGGSGLGLAIVNQIVLDHGGRVRDRQRRGARGTTVRVILPAA